MSHISIVEELLTEVRILLHLFLESFLKRNELFVDLLFDNLGCSLPGLKERSELDLLAHFGNPKCVTPILASSVNQVDQSASLPPYLIPAISMADYLSKANQRLLLKPNLLC